jgi:hypothetical protein
LISLSISLYLFNPVSAIVNWHAIAARTTMAVPEAPMDENHFFATAEDEIRTPR